MAKSGVSEFLRSVKLKCIDYPYPIYRIETQGEGSCFFHAILRALYKPYIEATSRQQRSQIAVNVRWTLANELEKINPDTGKRLYDTLGGGLYEEFSKGGDAAGQYSLLAMLRELRSNNPVDTAYQELCATFFGYDIYIINAERGDVYQTGNEGSLYKNRPSIFIYGMSGHYEILAVPMKQSGIYACLLTADHLFTVAVNTRVKALVSSTPSKVASIPNVNGQVSMSPVNSNITQVNEIIPTEETAVITRVTNSPGYIPSTSLLSLISNLNLNSVNS